MENRFQFPTFKQLFPVEKRWGKRLREFLRYHLRRIFYQNQIQQFCQFLNQHPHWIPLFTNNYYNVNTLLAKYCDQRFNVAQRLHALQDNFRLAEQYLGKEICNKLIQKEKICLAQLTDELSLFLTINEIDPFEGFFALNIQNTREQHIYDASFSFLSPNKLLIASIQGPNSDDAQERVKLATKELHGARPMYLLVDAFRIFSRQLGVELYGIAHKNQSKYRWNDHTKLLFNYDNFWQENQGNLVAEDYWQLPCHIERKTLDKIPSKKRSMYRKRFEMYDNLVTQLQSIFSEK